MMEQISDPELLKLAITESARLVPYVITSRKAIKLYLKVRTTLANWTVYLT
jgi:nucleolar complex protein 2